MSNDYYVVSGDSLRDVADSIRAKGGTSAQLEFPDGWMNAIDDIETGGGSIGNIWQDANGLIHLPVSGDDDVPDDGKTRIWISIADGTPDNRLTFYLRFTASVANNTTIDWGDGTSETLGSTTATNYPHTYSQGGDYVIAMTVNSGTIAFEGTSGSSGYSIYGARATSANNHHNRSRIQKVIIGENVTSIGTYAFYQCYSLKSITLSNGITSIGTYAFLGCYGLASITISNNVTNIGGSAFSGCYGITSITIPGSVTGIETYAFTNCVGMSEYHFKPTTPPTLENSNAFSSIPSDCIIYVPQGCLSTYQSATNYGNIASQMQEEPQS